MKKFLALMALLLCFMVLFVACDNNNEPEPSETPTDPIVEPAGCEHAYDNACDADCNLCGEKRAPTAHVEETLAAVAPTCTKAGLTEGKICKVCGVVTKAQEVAPATGHTEVTVEGTPATCTTAGLTDGTSCSVCNAVVKAQEVIFATGHNVEVVKGKAATCTEDGLTSGKQCSVCKVWVQEQEVIAATGHVEVKKESVAPTCTTPGYVGATVCGVCGEVLEGKVTEKALGHVVVDIPEVPSTCTTQGTAGGKMCSRCELVIIEPELQKLANHTVKKVPGYEATCTTAGLEDGSVCKDCGKVIKAQKIIPATHGELITLDAVAPTCTELGYTEGKVCSVCNEIVVAQEVLNYAHTYTYGCDASCALCGESRWTEAHHEMGFAKNGAIGCIHGCGTYYNDVAVDPATFTSGADLAHRVTVLGKDIATLGLITYNEEEGCVSIHGMTESPDLGYGPDPGTDRIVPVMFGPAFDGEGVSPAQRYVVMRYRTDTAEAELRFVVWGDNTTMSVNSNLGTGGEWKTVVIDLLQSTDQHQRFDIRCNIYANQTDFSHFASFSNLEEATAYAINLSQFVDNKCPHYAYDIGWDGTPYCTICYESVKPTTSHEGSELYNAVDPTSPDFSHVTDNGYKGVTITGVGSSNGGQSANLKLLSDVPFGQYAVIVYEFPALPAGAAYFGFCVDGELLQHYKATTATSGVFYFGNLENNKQIEGAGAPTGLNAGKNTYLDLVCNFAGLTESTRIKAIYTFDTAIEAQLYAEHVIAKKCFHDNATLNEATGHNVCNACGAVQGATAEWPLELNNGFVTTPTFALGTSLADPGVQEFHYSYYAEYDHRLVLDYYGDNISIIVNGSYATGLSADVKAGDKVEVVVYAIWDEETWELIPDGVFFIADKAVPGTANNPFELVLGETTTPEFIPGTGWDNPGVQQYYYKWVAVEDGKLTLSELDNLSWTVNGNWGEGYVADVKRGDVVEITVYMGMDENYKGVATPVTFSAEFDAIHTVKLNEDGSIGCVYCDYKLSPATYSAGQTLADKAFAGHAGYGNHGVYNAEGGYITIAGASTAGDAGTDKVYNINNGAKERYVVFRYRTTDPAVTFRFVSYNAACAEKWHDLGTNGAWQTIVVDAGATYGGWMEFRCNIYMNGNVPSEGAETNISHIVTFATKEEADLYANYVNIIETGVCPHNGYKTEVITPATCVTPGLSRLSCDACGLVVDQETGGSHKFAVDDAIVSCVLCGHVATNSVHVGADIFANSTVDSGTLIDKGANGVTVAGQPAMGAGNFLSINSDTAFGQHIILVYSINTRWGYIGSGLVPGCYASAGDMDVGAVRMDYFQNANVGNVLNLLCNFNDGNNNTTETNIIAVYTFDSFEAAAKYVESLSYQATTSHVGANLVASVDSATQEDAALMTKDAYSVTVKGVGTGAVGTTKIRLKNETGANFGQYVVILYKSNAINADGKGYLGITHTESGLVYSDGMNPSTDKVAVYQLGVPTGGTMGAELELLCNFGGNADTWTTIYGVYTFETAEAAAAFAALNG